MPKRYFTNLPVDVFNLPEGVSITGAKIEGDDLVLSLTHNYALGTSTASMHGCSHVRFEWNRPSPDEVPIDESLTPEVE